MYNLSRPRKEQTNKERKEREIRKKKKKERKNRRTSERTSKRKEGRTVGQKERKNSLVLWNLLVAAVGEVLLGCPSSVDTTWAEMLLIVRACGPSSMNT